MRKYSYSNWIENFKPGCLVYELFDALRKRNTALNSNELGKIFNFESKRLSYALNVLIKRNEKIISMMKGVRQ